MGHIQKLAGQTLWYGASNIGARFLNYLLTPLITYLLHNPEGVKDYGNYSLLYAWIAVANIVFTYGFETGYFRFYNQPNTDKKAIFQTTFGSIVLSSIGLMTLIILFREPINQLIGLGNHSEYFIWVALLIGLDAVSTIPFAKLRQEGRPKKYAFVKLSGIVMNILLVVFFLVLLPDYLKTHPQAFLYQWYNQNSAVGFLILANLIQNTIVFFLLYKEWRIFKFQINGRLWKQIFKYSAPIIIIGVAAMINEVMDRQMLEMFLPLSGDDARRIVGIYSANYKLAILISLFIQAFKMAAEPFFFEQAKDKNAPKVYAKVMKWFILTIVFAFLFTTLYLDIWKYFIGSSYRSGLGIVPILLAANICLGIYYNLSIWYKLTDKMMMGVYITLLGVMVTLIGNYFFIPAYGMYAAAWSTFSCYFLMMILSYLVGQKYYPIPYKVGKSGMHILIMLGVYFAYQAIHTISSSLVFHLVTATLFMGVFIVLVGWTEREEIKKMPVIRKIKTYFLKFKRS